MLVNHWGGTYVHVALADSIATQYPTRCVCSLSHPRSKVATNYEDVELVAEAVNILRLDLQPPTT